jgi:hypothetical protein
MVVKVHDGGPASMHRDTYASGFAFGWHNGWVKQYPITSGDIIVRR